MAGPSTHRFRCSRCRCRVRCISDLARWGLVSPDFGSPYFASTWCGDFFRGAMVHHTMAMPTANATNASMMNHSMALTFRCARHSAALALTASCLMFAGCQTTPVPATIAPPVAAAPAAPARPVFTPAAWSELPGWNADSVEAVWPAFRTGCRALLANPKTQPLWQLPCVDPSALMQPTRTASARFRNPFYPTESRSPTAVT
jgi:hypothetical protein